MVDKDDGILSSQASSAITNAFGMLSRERDVSVSGASLEEIVTQIMKPLLAQWLDEHLPEIVERVDEIVDPNPVYAQYDPPWTMGFLRRNELMLEVKLPPPSPTAR